MADKEKYLIKIQGELIEVSEDIYYTYFRMERQERGQDEKRQRNFVVSYDALDTEETTGAEAMPDLIIPSPEHQIISQEIHDTLHRVVNALPRAERDLIKAIYFEGMSENDYAKVSGMSQTGVSYRRRKILSKLKLLLGIMGSFC